MSTSTNAGPNVAAILRVATTRTMRQLRAVGAHRITLTQLSAMASIHRAGELTLGELASRERVQPPSMTRVITTLHDHGLVVRRPDPTDGRQVLVSLTPSGVQILEEEAETREAWLADQIKTLSDDERDTLIRASEILMRLIGE